MPCPVATASPLPEVAIADPAIGTLRRMTEAQLQQLGMTVVGYVKAYRVRDRGLVYVTHAADGRAVAMTDDVDLTLQHAQENNLHLLPLH